MNANQKWYSRQTSTVEQGQGMAHRTHEINKELSSTEHEQPIVIFESPEKNVIWLLVLAQ